MQVLDQEFRAWQADLEARGFFKPSYMHVTCRLLEIVAIYALGCAALSVLPDCRLPPGKSRLQQGYFCSRPLVSTSFIFNSVVK